MSSVNKAIIVGNVGKDPEIRYMPSGDAVANLTVATSENLTDKASGEKKEATEWHRVSLFGRTAEVAGQYVKKGAKVYIEGSIRTRKWTDKDGNERYTTEIKGDVMRMLDRKGDGEERPAAPPPAPVAAKPAPAPVSSSFDDMDDDVPY